MSTPMGGARLHSRFEDEEASTLSWNFQSGERHVGVMDRSMWDVVARFGLLAAAILLALLIGERAVFYGTTGTSTILGAAAAVVLAAGFLLGRMVLRRNPSVEASDSFRKNERIEALGISEREYEVLELVASGLSNREIADRLFIAETTVKTHVSSLLGKLNARRRTEAVSKAQDEGILP